MALGNKSPKFLTFDEWQRLEPNVNTHNGIVGIVGANLDNSEVRYLTAVRFMISVRNISVL